MVKPGGFLHLHLPNKRYCFDHKRPITSFEHLLEDFENKTDEKDLTHLDEILKLHDLKKDKPAGTKEQFKARSLENYKNRCLHHYVFDIPLLVKIYEYFEMEVLATYSGRDHIILGRK